MRSSFLAGVAGLLGLSGLGGCPKGHGGATPSHTAPSDGLTIAIYTGVDAPAADAPTVDASGNPIAAATRTRSLALVDDRRTLDVDADGAIHLDQVAEGLELASLIVEPLDGHRFVIRTCARQAGIAATVAEHAATVVTSDGAEVEGRVRDSHRDDGTWVVEDEQGRAHFVKGLPDRVTLHDTAAIDVHCQVDAEPGAHRVRLAYATTDLSWQASYRVDVAVAPKPTATVQPTFTIAGSGVIGSRRATVSLLVGLPGGEASPRLAWTGDVDLGTDEVAVQPTARVLPAQLEYLYRGAVTHKDDNPRINYWRGTSTVDVWFAIGIAADDAAATADLPGGVALISVTQADGTVRMADGMWPEPDPEPGHGIDVRLWPSADLLGWRERKTPYEDGQRLVEQYLYSVSNHSTEPVTVWVEEELRPGATWHELRKLWPMKPEIRGSLLRFKVKVAAGKIERLGFEAEYRW
jgi:hypothetical protein